MLKEKLSHLWAACCMFTRIPLWKIWSAPVESYPYAVHHWMIAGGLIAALWSSIIFLGIYPWFPASITVLILMVGSLFISGGFHEDGLADFVDGFGGGMTKERILDIMKDSHIGTYGVLALLSYFLTTFVSIGEWSSNFAGLYHSSVACFLIYTVTAIWSRFLASFVPATLKYARTSEGAKIKMIYAPWTKWDFIYMFVVAVLTLFVFLYFFPFSIDGLVLWFLTPVIVLLFLYGMMKKRLQGYTGDCCGATVLLCELSMNMTMAILSYFHVTTL